MYVQFPTDINVTVLLEYFTNLLEVSQSFATSIDRGPSLCFKHLKVKYPNRVFTD